MNTFETSICDGVGQRLRLIGLAVHDNDMLEPISIQSVKIGKQFIPVGVGAETIHDGDFCVEVLFVTEYFNCRMLFHKASAQRVFSHESNYQHSVSRIWDIVVQMVKNATGFAHA